MAYTTIDDPSEHFNTILYTGNNAANRSITGAGLQPDWGWLKQRNGTGYHELYDSSRGVTKALHSNTNDAEVTTSALDSFDSDGITVSYDSSNSGSNGNGKTVAWWLWKANGGTTSSNTDGDITSTVQANNTAGFSIVTYTANGSNTDTVGHGLSKQLSMVFTKKRNAARSWHVGHKDMPFNSSSNAHNGYISLDSTMANEPSNGGRANIPNATTFQGESSDGDTMVAYCFAEIQGYSKFGKYTGNGNADGTFVYTGFKPKYLLQRRTNASGQGWTIQNPDNQSYNEINNYFFAQHSGSTFTGYAQIDFLSNGFKIRTADAQTNGSGDTYIYMAFAEHPFVSSKGAPVTAR